MSNDLTLTQRATLRTADRRFVPKMITAATMLSLLFVVVMQTQGRRRADDLLLRRQPVKLEAVPEILQSPVVHERWFATALRHHPFIRIIVKRFAFGLLSQHSLAGTQVGDDFGKIQRLCVKRFVRHEARQTMGVFGQV